MIPTPHDSATAKNGPALAQELKERLASLREQRANPKNFQATNRALDRWIWLIEFELGVLTSPQPSEPILGGAPTPIHQHD